MKSSKPEERFASLVQEFFLQRLVQQRNASPQTVAAYRDTFRLLLTFARDRCAKPPERFTLADLDSSLVLSFLNYLENERRNSIRSRNARLAAIRSFMRFAALQDSVSLPTVHQVLAIPFKRCDKPLLGYLTREQVDALLDAPDAGTWTGQRDRALFMTMYNTGARVSETVGMTVADLNMEAAASIRIRGKGRKERAIPIWPRTTRQLRQWLPRIDCRPDKPLFPGRSGAPMTRSAIAQRLKRALKIASSVCTGLTARRISPHTLRHSTAMHMLQSGVDLTVIALWLGHESPSTTHGYVEADLTMKQRALSTLRPPGTRSPRYRPPDRLLEFLQNL
jgi:integrase/recombinase XerD